MCITLISLLLQLYFEKRTNGLLLMIFKLWLGSSREKSRFLDEMDTPPRETTLIPFLSFFSKGKNFCDIFIASQHTKVFYKIGSTL